MPFSDTVPPVTARIGAHTGDVVRAGEDFFGTTVNYAARVASHALGGEVVVSVVTHDLVRHEQQFTFAESREVELKGLPASHKLFSLALS
jgi:adenylate cyclase